MAKELKSSWVVVSDDPFVELYADSNFFPVRRAIVIDMVDRKELGSALPAACTPSAIMLDDRAAKARSFLPRSLLIYGVICLNDSALWRRDLAQVRKVALAQVFTICWGDYWHNANII